ncbi:MAG: signal peptidase II [Gaiellaceae bacterium]
MRRIRSPGVGTGDTGSYPGMVEVTIERRQRAGPKPAGTEVARARLFLIVIAASVCAYDLLVKIAEPTRSGYYHKRSGFDLVLVLVITCALTYVAPRIRSRTLVVGAGLMAGGGLGNALSIVLFPQGVPNPFLISHGNWTVALNLADISVLLGFALSLVAIFRFAAEMRAEPRRSSSGVEQPALAQRGRGGH